LIKLPFIWSQSCGSREVEATLLTWLTALGRERVRRGRGIGGGEG
jgi:hypothetical protein